MHVRRATHEDLPAVGDLTVAAYERFLDGPDDPYTAQLRNAQARMLEAELWVAVAEDDRQVLGAVTICPDGSPWREIGVAGEGEFRMLAVAPSARRQGAAEALVQACVDRCRELGYTAVVLSSLPVQVEAHRLYDRLGFRRTPEKDWSPVPGIDLIGFRLDL